MSSINFSPSSSLSLSLPLPFSKKGYCVKLARTICHTLSMIWARSQKTRRRLTIQMLFILVKLCQERSSFCKKLTLHVNVGHTGQPGCKTFNSQSPRTSSFQSKFSCSDDKRDISYWLFRFSFSPSSYPINIFFRGLPELPLPPLQFGQCAKENFFSPRRSSLRYCHIARLFCQNTIKYHKSKFNIIRVYHWPGVDNSHVCFIIWLLK